MVGLHPIRAPFFILEIAMEQNIKTLVEFYAEKLGKWEVECFKDEVANNQM